MGDTYGRPDWSDGHTRQLLISFIHSQMTPEQQAKLNAIADPYARLQAALAMSEGAPGPAPARCSQTFPGSGYTVMRSGWEPDEARYLYFDLTPQGMGHAHNDAGHFDLYGYGRPLLADTGDYFLGWGYRAALHNTIEVDGRDQARGAAKAPMLPCDWASSEGFDLVEGAHGAYGDLGVIHRRKVTFVKRVGEAPDYFVLCDRLTGTGSHASEQFFHFAGRTQMQAATVQLDPQSLVARSTEVNVANVEVIPAATEGLTAQMVAAQDTDMKPEDKYERAAMLGWMVTSGCFQRTKAPVVAYRLEGPLPQSYADVLFPIPAGARAEVKVASLPVTEGGKAVTAHEALGLQVDWKITRPKHAADELTPKLGANLALGKPGFAEVSQGQIAPTSELLTDGDPSPEKIAGAVSSGPYTPGVLLTGRFTVDLGQETEVNTVVLHHGTWNGSTTLYAAEKLSIQAWDGQAWRDAPNQKTEWRAGSVSQTVFDPVRTTRLSVAVERTSGGRIALREFEAYRIPEAEVQRVAAMARETVSQSGSDLILISHTGAATRTYGSVTLDGEMAIVRRNAAGKTLRVAVREEESLTGAGPAYRWPDRAPCWTGQTPPPAGPPARAPLVMSDLRVQMQPAQEGFAAAQPSAVITWTTSRPCRSQVCFQEEGVGLRRTPLSDRLDTRHSVTAWFLRPDQPYEFQAVAIGEDGARKTATVRP